MLEIHADDVDILGRFFHLPSSAAKRNVQIRFYPYTLELRHPFTVAVNSRTTTPVMLVEVEQDGFVGYGEASMPPYLGENHETAAAFLSKIDINKYSDDGFSYFDDIHWSGIDLLAPGNHAAKAAVDIALHDWFGKKAGSAWYRILRLDPAKTPLTSFTIGIDTREIVRQKVKEAEQCKILKVKLRRDNDREIIEAVRELTDKPIRVDVNQGWKDKSRALKMIEWLATKNVELVEQPMPAEMVEEHAWLAERSPLPIIGDESVVRFPDVRKAVGVYHGINIKLMKCTGMREAIEMIHLARKLGLKVMLGCMTETSCAISAAAQLSPMVDYADLDGALLIKNDPFRGVTVVDGKIAIPQGPGIGVVKVQA